MESGLSVTRMTSAIKGTHLNIYPEDDDVISLIAKQHNMRCRVYTILQRNAVNVGSSTENENVSFINGLKNYPNLMSIIAAPEECLCTKCLYTVVPPRHKIPSRDMFGFQRLTGLDSLKNAVRTQHGPSFPEYADKMTRVSNLMNHDPEVAGIIAEAGFFSGKYKVLLSYFMSYFYEVSILVGPRIIHVYTSIYIPDYNTESNNTIIYFYVSLKNLFALLSRPLNTLNIF